MMGNPTKAQLERMLEVCRDNPRAEDEERISMLEMHMTSFAEFVNELYATMVDPVDNPPTIGSAMPLILEAARQQREQLNAR